MSRIRGYLVLVIIFAIAVHLVWDDLAPMIPYTIEGLVAVVVMGFFYFRRRW